MFGYTFRCFDNPQLNHGVKLNNHWGLLEPPIYRNDSVERFYYTFTAQRQEQLDTVIELLVRSKDPDNFAVQCAIYDEVGLDSDSLSDEECEYIISGVREYFI